MQYCIIESINMAIITKLQNPKINFIPFLQYTPIIITTITIIRFIVTINFTATNIKHIIIVNKLVITLIITLITIVREGYLFLHFIIFNFSLKDH